MFRGLNATASIYYKITATQIAFIGLVIGLYYKSAVLTQELKSYTSD